MEYSFEGSVQSEINRELVINKLIDISDSTTKYLEELKGLNLKASLEKQTILVFQNKMDIVRYSMLYFDDVSNVILYCACLLNRVGMSDEEFWLIKEGKVPIGRIFIKSNNSIFKKKNIRTSEISCAAIARKLNAKSDTIYKKAYTLVVGEREMGVVTEYFNSESVSRLFI